MTATSLPIEQSAEITFADDQALLDWLQTQAQTHQLKYLLAHAEDGVIWGKFEQGQLITAAQISFQLLKLTPAKLQHQLPALRLLTLQQCRIFGVKGEVLLWRTDRGWRSRFCSDPEDPERIIEEKQLLWGTQGEEKDGFTLLADGRQGLHHAVPLTQIVFDKKTEQRPVRLKVHHYVDYDEDGVAYISASRLVDLVVSPRQEN